MPTKNLGDALVNIKVNVEGLAQLAGLRSQLRNITSQTKTFRSVLEDGGKSLINYVRDIRQVSFALRDAGRQFVLFGLAGVAALTAIAVEGAKFEQGVADVKAVIGELAEGGAFAEAKLSQLSDTLLDVAASTVFTAEEVAGAAKQLALAGFSAREVEESIRGIANLAAASGETAEDTARTAVTVLRGFGIAADEIDRVSDTLTAVFTNTNTTLSTLRESLKLATPVAAAFGVSLEETAAAIGLLGQSGVTGSLAGTGLSRLIVQLSTDVDDLNAILLDVGSSADAVNPLKVGIQGAVQELRNLLIAGKVTQAQLADTFDQRALRALLNLISLGDDAFEELNEKIAESAGLTERIAQIKLDTVTGQFTILTSAISRLVTEVFATFAKDLQNLIETITGVVNSLTEWVKANRETVRVLALLAAGVAAVNLAIGGLILVTGQLVAIYATGALIFGGFALALKAVTFAVNSLAAGMVFLGVTTGGATIALGLIITGVVAATAAVIAFHDEIASGVTGFLQWVGILESVEDSAARVAPLTQEVKELSTALNEVAKEAATAARQLQEYTQIIGEGGLATANQIQQASQLSEELGGTSISAIANQIRDIGRKRTEISNELAMLRKKAAEEQSEALDKEIAVAEAKYAALDQQFLKLRTSFEKLNALQQTLADGENTSFGDITSGVSTQLQSLTDELTVLKAEFDASASQIGEDERRRLLGQVTEIEDKIERLKFVQKFLNSFNEEIFEIFRSKVPEEGLLGALQAAQDFKDGLAEARDEAKALQKQLAEASKEAIEELDRLLPQVFEFTSSRIDEQLAELRDIEQKIRDAYATLVMTADFSEIPTLFGMLQQALDALADKRVDALTEQNKRRDDEIRKLKQQRAKAEKDVKEAERLLREERAQDLQDKLDNEFDIPEGLQGDDLKEIERDRLEFTKEYNRETEDLVKNLKEQLTVTEEVADKIETINLQETERNKLEESVGKALIDQVKSLEDAARVTQFLRAESRRRAADALRAAKEQEFVESRLLRAVEKRAKVAASGGDTSALDERIRRLQVRVEGAQQIADLRGGEAGFKKRERNFDTELEEAQKRGESQAKAMKMATDATDMFADALVQLSNFIFGLPLDQLPLLGNTTFGGVGAAVPTTTGIPVPGNSSVSQSATTINNNYTDQRVITIEINEASDAQTIADRIAEFFTRGPLGIRGGGL